MPNCTASVSGMRQSSQTAISARVPTSRNSLARSLLSDASALRMEPSAGRIAKRMLRPRSSRIVCKMRLNWFSDECVARSGIIPSNTVASSWRTFADASDENPSAIRKSVEVFFPR